MTLPWLVLVSGCLLWAPPEEVPDLDPSCRTWVAETIPDDEAVDVYYRTRVAVTFDRFQEGDATVFIRDARGTAVAGEAHWQWNEGETLILTPNEPLEPETRYAVDIEHPCGEETTHFTTGTAGLPVHDSVRVGVWVVDISLGDWWMDVEWIPEDLLRDHVAAPLYLAFSDDGRLLGLVSEVGPLDPCVSAFATQVRWEGPWFETTEPLVVLVPMNTGLGPMRWELDHLSAALRSDGLLQGELVGVVDVRTIMEEDQALMYCRGLPAEGVECVPCADREVACLPLRVDDLWGERVIGTDTMDGALDADGDGYSDCLDCAPTDDQAFPGAEERCNGLDDDCDDVVDEGFPDTDGDGIADCVDPE